MYKILGLAVLTFTISTFQQISFADSYSGQHCGDSGNCAGSLVCRNHVCIPKGGLSVTDWCNSSDQCSGSLVCRHNQCIPHGGLRLGQACSTSDNCSGNLLCRLTILGSICVKRPGLDQHCMSTDDCMGNLKCRSHLCVPPTGLSKGKYCTDSDQCSGHLVCSSNWCSLNKQ